MPVKQLRFLKPPRNKLQYDFVIPEVKEYEIVFQQSSHKNMTCTSKHLILENTWTRYRVWPWIKSDSSLELLTAFDHLRSGNFLVNTQNVSRNQYPALMKWAFLFDRRRMKWWQKSLLSRSTHTVQSRITHPHDHTHMQHIKWLFLQTILHTNANIQQSGSI